MADSQKNSRHPRMAVVLGVVLIVLGVFNLAGNVFPAIYGFASGRSCVLFGELYGRARSLSRVCIWYGLLGVGSWPASPRQGREARSAVAWKIAGFWEYAAA